MVSCGISPGFQFPTLPLPSHGECLMPSPKPLEDWNHRDSSSEQQNTLAVQFTSTKGSKRTTQEKVPQLSSVSSFAFLFNMSKCLQSQAPWVSKDKCKISALGSTILGLRSYSLSWPWIRCGTCLLLIIQIPYSPEREGISRASNHTLQWQPSVSKDYGRLVQREARRPHLA